MIIATYTLFSPYSIIELADPLLPVAGVRPTQQHILQGFTWRPGCVTFRLLDDLSDQRTEVVLAAKTQPNPAAERAIVVPFEVSAANMVAISDMVTTEQFSLREGTYALLFETGRIGDEACWLRLTFVPNASPIAAVLRADDALAPQYPLLMTAEPA